VAVTVDLGCVVDALSREAGCPLVVADGQGAVLASPARHPVPCFTAPGFDGTCVGARAFAQSPVAGAVLRHCPKNGQVHLVVGVDGGSRAVVLAELWLAGAVRGARARARRAARVLAAVVREALPEAAPEAPAAPGEVPSELLRQALADGRIRAPGLWRMRTRYRLSWRELEVLVLYYLTPQGPDARARRSVGQTLGLTEGTVREYVRRLRRKLRLRFRRSPEIWAWAQAEGLVGEAVR
jgi:DNA-binding CsgD family transcriptional regulator